MTDQLERVDGALVEHFGASNAPVDVVSAPGRVNLIGGHTDYNEGLVLPMGIDRRIAVAVRPSGDGAVSVHSLEFGETRRFELDRLASASDDGWGDYVIGVAASLGERGHDLDGVAMAAAGDVPMGAGLSSSASFEVALAGGLAAANDLTLSDDELVSVCWEAETEYVGVDCGIMDQYTAVHAEPASALVLDCQSESHEVVPLPAAELAVVATDTTVRRGLVDSAYNDRVATCREGVAYFDSVLDRTVDSLRDVTLAEFDAHEAALEETVRKRVRHVVSENERVREAATALREGDLYRVGDLLEASHESLREDYEVSVEELDAVVDIAAEQEGVYGSRMTGAGFGGCVVTLVHPDTVPPVTDAIDREYPDRTGIEPDVYVCNPDGGIGVDDFI